VGAIVLVIAIAVVVALALAGCTWLWARTVAARMKHQGEEFRQTEAKTGRCAACDGVGTRIEGLPGLPQATLGQVECYRCGGTGLPPPPDRVPALWPTPLGLKLRQLRELRRRE
jgi:hypothetical protein